jgi:hypothetical protein
MPKAKPDQVIVHRIELQETERATLEAALAGRFVTNAAQAGASLIQGIGAALAPFSGAFQILAGAWVANRTWDELVDKVLDPIVDELQRPVIEKYAGDYAMIVAWLNTQYASGGWDFLGQDYSSHDAYFATSEGVSTLWRGNYEQSYGWKKLGDLPVGTYQWVSGSYSQTNGTRCRLGWLIVSILSAIQSNKTPPPTKRRKPPQNGGSNSTPTPNLRMKSYGTRRIDSLVIGEMLPASSIQAIRPFRPVFCPNLAKIYEAS